MDDPDLTASGVIIEMNCSSAHIRDVNVAYTDSAPQFNRMMNGFCGRSAELLYHTVFGCSAALTALLLDKVAQCLLWVICRHTQPPDGMSASPLKADIRVSG
jgi:hypothetical protein